MNLPVEATDNDKAIIQTVLKSHNGKPLTMLSPMRLWSAISSVNYVVENNIDGDIVECGVWRGGCSIAMALKLKELNSNKKVILYDTFAGMTEPSEYDTKFPHRDGKQRPTSGYDKKFLELQREDHNEWCYSSLEDVINNFKDNGVYEYAIFVKGDVRQTLSIKKCKPTKGVSLLRLDTDFYDSTVAELENLYPLLSINGICLLDDYGSWEGQKKAVDEYFQNKRFDNRRPLFSISDDGGRLLVKI